MDERIWFYILAAIVWYFIKRKKKAPEEEAPEATSNRPQQQRRQVSFEDLLKEITEQREQEARPSVPAPMARPVQQRVEEEEDLPLRKLREEKEALEREGRNRHFADEETRRVYEESVRMAEGFDIEFAPDKKFVKENLFKGKAKTAVAEASYGDEIRESLRKPDSARKAIIYAEILNIRY